MAPRTSQNWRPRTGVAAPALLIWISSATVLFLLLRTLLSMDSSSSLNAKRTLLYNRMASDLDLHGAAFLQGGNTSQSFLLSDLFRLENGLVTPILNAANPPVRANVLHLTPQFAEPISDAVREIFSPYFDGVIWFQNSSIYHSSMFHASHHISPVPATDSEIEAEANAVERVTKSLCPLRIVLDKVVLTSTGVLLGCWQVLAGTDPAVIREKLRNALPHAPQKQLYDSVLLHTSFARLLGPPKVPQEKEISNPLHLFHEMVVKLNYRLHGFEATMSELWYVEEYDVLALALNGRMKIRRFPLHCSGN